MKIYPEEIRGIKMYQEETSIPLEAFSLSNSQLKSIQHEVNSWINFEKRNFLLHTFLTLLPIALLIFGIYFTLFPLASMLAAHSVSPWVSTLCLGVILGFLQYSFVIYTLHEGGGHLVFLKGTQHFKMIKTLLNQSSRLFFADPEFYKKNHLTHHLNLGTENDATNTQFVLPLRFLKSVLPGAGIIFPNDFQVWQNTERTQSRMISDAVGVTTLILMNFVLAQKIGIGFSLLTTLIITPWFGLTLDRIRECSEHNLLPAHNQLGTRQLGLTPIALIISGGPWGQPCHVSHHLAPSLNWYQQIHFHFVLKRLLNHEQKKLFGFHSNDPIPLLFLKLLIKNQSILNKMKHSKSQEIKNAYA